MVEAQINTQISNSAGFISGDIVTYTIHGELYSVTSLCIHALVLSIESKQILC